MATNANPVIARQGWPLIALLLVLTIAAKLYVGWTSALILLFLMVTVILLFRDPRRSIPPAPLAVLSPATGRVTAVETVTDPWLDRQALLCRIHMSLWDVHSLRSPTEGKIMEQWTLRDEDAGGRRRYTYWIKTDEGDDVILSFVAGWPVSVLRLTLHCGDRLGQGQPCGFLFFAGMIEVYLPETSRVEIEAGRHVDSGTAILGRFVHNPGTSAASA